MRGYQKRQIKYGITTGVFIFGVLWLLAALLVENPPEGVPMWRASLWVVLGMHFIELWQDTGIYGGELVSVAEVFEDVPVRELRAAPPVTLAAGSFYAAWKISYTRRLKYILTNAASVLAGYLPAMLVAFVVSDINPPMESLVLLVGGLALAVYLGSMVLTRLTGSLPFFGITTLGTIILVGVIALVFATAVIGIFGPAVAVSAVGVSAGAAGVYYRRGSGGVLSFLSKNAIIIVLFLMLGAGLYFALGGPVPEETQNLGSWAGDLELGNDINESEVEKEFIVVLNEERDKRGLGAVSRYDGLSGVASSHATDMAENEFMAHEGSDGRSPHDRVTDAGLSAVCRSSLENVAETPVNQRLQAPDGGTERVTSSEELAEMLYQQWYHSDPHREAMFTSGVSNAGLGVGITDDTAYTALNLC